MEVWGFLWLMVALKVPVAVLLWLVWWAARAEPEPETGDDGDGGIRGPREKPPEPGGPRRRGPHGEPITPPPPRTRTPVRSGKRTSAPRRHAAR